MPTYNSAKFLREAIDSVLAQDYTHWDMLIINEFGSDDGTAEIVLEYEKLDTRIKLLQNEQKLGLAESLNRGLRIASGKYIARLDADDIALPNRFGKQVAYLNEHKNVAVCGSWQQHFGTENWIHKPPSDANLCHAFLLFNCHLCHSTVMLRKSFFLENGLFYDGRYLAEDFELWTRVMSVGEIANIPEVLGMYRHGARNITELKFKQLNNESGCIVAASLKRCLGLELQAESCYLLNTWNNLYVARFLRKRKAMLLQLENILKKVWELNQRTQFCANDALLVALHSKWRWAKYSLDWKEVVPVRSVDEVFLTSYRCTFWKNLRRFLSDNRSFAGCLSKAVRRLIQRI